MRVVRIDSLSRSTPQDPGPRRARKNHASARSASLARCTPLGSSDGRVRHGASAPLEHGRDDRNPVFRGVSGEIPDGRRGIGPE